MRRIQEAISANGAGSGFKEVIIGPLTAVLPSLLFLLALSCGPAATPSAEAQSTVHNQLTPEEAADGWILLFDGKSLEAWENPAKETPAGDAWLIEDGCIKAVDHPRLREDLLTLESFGDFEFAFDWKISPGGNSGVKYRIQDRVVLVEGLTDPETEQFEDRVEYEFTHRRGLRNRLGPQDRIEEYLIAFEYQIIDNEGHPDAAENISRTAGAIYGLAAPSERVVRPVGEFNQSRIVLRENRVEHWLNGTRIVEVDLGSETIRSGLNKRWPNASPVYQLLTEMPKRKTPVALQHHNDEVWFRNLKIRRLD